MKSNKPFVRDPYNYDTNAASDESGIGFLEPSLTQQHFKDETDINYILDRFGVDGVTNMVQNPLQPRYGDFTDVVDYHSALNSVIAAEDDFMALPAILRARFDNDPAKLIDFLNDPANRPEAEKLGLVNKTEPVPVALLDATGTGDTKPPISTKPQE